MQLPGEDSPGEEGRGGAGGDGAGGGQVGVGVGAVLGVGVVPLQFDQRVSIKIRKKKDKNPQITK